MAFEDNQCPENQILTKGWLNQAPATYMNPSNCNNWEHFILVNC